MTLLLSPALRRRAAPAILAALFAATPALAQAPSTAPPAAPSTTAPVTPSAPAAQAPVQTTPAQPEQAGPAPAPVLTPRAAAQSAPPAPSADSAPTTATTTSASPAAGAPSPAPAEPAASPAETAAPTEMMPESTEPMLAADGAEAVPEATLPHDLSPWGMFMAADIVVKAVMGGLAFASVVTFTILLAKGVEIFFAKGRARRGIRRLVEAETLAGAIGDEGRGRRWRGPVALLARSAEDERRRSAGLSAEGVKERVAIALQRVEAGAGRSITRGTGLLATIGSTAPFVGLFGTVWGIMNSFIGISQANTTNLAVVAPGIAEALLATAIGLVAAIPAIVIYNVFARSISGYRAILSDGSALVMQHLSRQLDRAKVEGAPPARAGGPLAQAAE